MECLFLTTFVVGICTASAAAASRTHVQGGDVGIEIDLATGTVHALTHRPRSATWAHQSWEIYRVQADGRVTAMLDAQPTPEGVQLSLQLRNDDDRPLRVTPTFPLLELRGSDAAQTRLLRYCFPARSALVGTAPTQGRGYYSGIYPVQYFAADHPDQGALYAIVQDTDHTRKLFGLDKTDELLRLFVEHEGRDVAPGDVWTLPPVLLNASSGTWHAGLRAYRDWLATWYAPASPRQQWFAEVFNFRTYYLHLGQPRGTEIMDAQTNELRLEQAVERDTEAFGGVDFVHLFDWAYTPEHGRVGHYAPWKKFGGVERFNHQLTQLRRRDIWPGLYLEGYLVTQQSPLGRELGELARMTDAKGENVNVWGGPYFTMCPHVPQWQESLAKIYKQVATDTNAVGLYIDQFGFLTQYRCHNPEHAAHHAPGAHMMAGELQMLRTLRQAVGDRVVLYTEETPTDVMTQFIDGAYTASVHMAMNHDLECPINLTRFALPDFKQIELISEAGMGDNLKAVRLCFFNGNGIYLAGDADERFSGACRTLIRKTHRLLREHRDAFTSRAPLPLVETEHAKLFANRFPAADRVVWTLYNGSADTVSGRLLRVRHVPGATYYDAWNDTPIEARIDGNVAALKVTLEGEHVGMLVQKMPAADSCQREPANVQKPF